MRKEFFTTLRVDSFFSTPQTPMYRQVDKRTKRYFYSRSFIFYTIKRKYRIIQHIWISFFTYPYSSYIFFLFFLTTNSRLRSSKVTCYEEQINVHRAFENISIRGILSQTFMPRYKFLYTRFLEILPSFLFFPAFAATMDLFTLGIS